MKPTPCSAHLSLDHRPPWRMLRVPGSRLQPGSRGIGPGRSWERLRRLPRWVHAVPYAALLVLGGVLLAPGVVPLGPECGNYPAAPLGERNAFIQSSAVAFGLVAGLLILSALVASAQRRRGRPGRPTIVAALGVGVVALAAVISPHGPASYLVRFLMTFDVLGVVSGGIGLAVPMVAGSLAWPTLPGPRSLRAAQIGAWITALYVLPFIMALTYERVTPLCWG